MIKNEVTYDSSGCTKKCVMKNTLGDCLIENY